MPVPEITDYSPHDLIALLVDAVCEVLHHPRLSKFAPTEVAVSFEIGWALKTRFPDWDVSGEYDRVDRSPKTLDYVGRPPRKRSNRIRPDLLVHFMGIKKNLLVVEMKLKGNNTNWEFDHWKLQGLTYYGGKYAYRLGAHLVIDLASKTVEPVTIYENAEPVPELAEFFTAFLT